MSKPRTSTTPLKHIFDVTDFAQRASKLYAERRRQMKDSNLRFNKARSQHHLEQLTTLRDMQAGSPESRPMLDLEVAVFNLLYNANNPASNSKLAADLIVRCMAIIGHFSDADPMSVINAGYSNSVSKEVMHLRQQNEQLQRRLDNLESQPKVDTHSETSTATSAAEEPKTVMDPSKVLVYGRPLLDVVADLENALAEFKTFAQTAESISQHVEEAVELAGNNAGDPELGELLLGALTYTGLQFREKLLPLLDDSRAMKVLEQFGGSVMQTETSEPDIEPGSDSEPPTPTASTSDETESGTGAPSPGRFPLLA